MFDKDQITKEIVRTTPFVLNNFRLLRKIDPNDHYWSMFTDTDRLTINGVFIETAMVVSWIGNAFKPKTILEIGTRTGGSLIALLSNYQDFKNIEVVSFDLWREYFSATFISKKITRLKSRNKNNDEFTGNINISEKKLRPFFSLIRNLSIHKVRRNLDYFNIPCSIITFISGDSKKTVPAYFNNHPGKKFDYILVDGAHDKETALIDLQNIADHVAEKGVVVFDDISDMSYNLMDVWIRFKELQKDQFDFMEIECRKGIGLAFKKKAV
jgi:predicted O-methyltransferase YrrM